jgi:lysophospholipase L1-like esterase
MSTAALPKKNIFCKHAAAALLVFLVVPQIAFAAAIRIMPLGDSITKGYINSDCETSTCNGYRKPLYNLITGFGGYEVDFVGSLQHGDFDENQHEGHAGYMADVTGVEIGIGNSIALETCSWISVHPADIVLLHAGTNDIVKDPNDIGKILDEIYSCNDRKEKTWVVLALIINRYNGDNQATTAFNQALRSYAENRIAQGDKIVIVDQEHALVYPADMYNEEHPKPSGYQKMADAWWLQGLQAILPVASAGDDQKNVNPGVTVSLSGANSTGTNLVYAWSQIAGSPNVTIVNANAANASFTAPGVSGGTTLTFRLIVTDGNQFSHSDECYVDVNGPPLAAAGADQVVNPGALVTLDGTASTDPGGDVQSYHWQQTAGSASVNLAGADSSKATFTAPPAGSGGLDLTFSLTVTDDKGARDDDTCIVHMNGPPVADAGTDQHVSGGSVVVLDGALSKDADGAIATYRWTQVDGSPAVTLIGSDTSKASFTAPDAAGGAVRLTFQLTVTDNLGVQAVDSVTVDISVPPIADAGADQEVESGSIVNLDGSESAGGTNDLASYAWVQTSGPHVTLSDPGADKPTFSAPSGITSDVTLTFLLTVTDAAGLQATDSCTVTVIAEHRSSGSGAGGGGGGGGCFITTAADRSIKGSAREKF